MNIIHFDESLKRLIDLHDSGQSRAYTLVKYLFAHRDFNNFRIVCVLCYEMDIHTHAYE